MKKRRLLLTTTKGLMGKPVLDGVAMDNVASVEFTAGPYGPPKVTLNIETDVVFNGHAYVDLVSIRPEVGPDAKRSFANALNEADLRARQRGKTPGSRRLPESADVTMLIEEMDALGWGFYSKRSSR